MNNMMKRTTFILVFLISFVSGGYAALLDSLELKPKPVYGKEERVVSYILDNNHYRKIKLNDSLSAVILDQYIKELDNSKTYFLASDVKSFERYKYSLDDLIRNENVVPAYDIYSVFTKRWKERMDYVMNTLIKQEFDYS